MKLLLIPFVLLLGGCAVSPATRVPSDYITGLRDPVMLSNVLVGLGESLPGMQFVDSTGRESFVYQLCTGVDASGRNQYSLILASAQGRPVDFTGEEGAKLLQILDDLKATDVHEIEYIRWLSAFIRAKRAEPNKTSRDINARDVT